MEKDKNKRKMIYNIKRIAYEFRKDLIKYFLLSIPFGFISSIYPFIYKYVIDNYINESNNNIMNFVFIILLFIFLNAAVFYLFMNTAVKLQTNVHYSFMGKMFNKMHEMTSSYMDTHPQGWILSRITSDVFKIEDVFAWYLFDLLEGVLYFFFYFGAMFLLDARLSIRVAISIPFVFAVSMIYNNVSNKIYKKIKISNANLTSLYNEGIKGAVTTKLLNRQDLNLDEFKKEAAVYRRENLKITRYSALYIPSLEIIGAFAVGFIIYKGGYKTMLGDMSIGTLFALITYTISVYEPVRMICSTFSAFIDLKTSLERVYDFLDEEPKIKDNDELKEKYGESFDGEKEPMPHIKGAIELSHVNFSYEGGKNIFKDLNLKIKEGESVALVGETGGGKSSLVNLVARFYEPDSGNVYIDGIDYRSMPMKWIQKNLGYVLQTPFIFKGSVIENIRYGNESAARDEIIEACKKIGLHDAIMSLKNGYDEKIGEGGVSLSTGQKQLISFVRVFLRNPSILILDEATSSVDTQTERLIQNATRELLKGRTSLIVAHRLSTIVNSDRIILIENGRIEEEGSHKDLIKLRKKYYQLYKNQFIEEELSYEKLQEV